MPNIEVEDIATIIYEEFLCEGSDDRIFPIVNLLTKEYLEERVETHLEVQGHDEIMSDEIDMITEDVKIIIIRKVEILLNGWKTS